VAEGTPEEVAEVESSFTGQYLQRKLAGHRAYETAPAARGM
jgi:hypothetical protein